MSTYYERLQVLSDENLLRRISRKELYHREAIDAAYQILVDRGYNLDYPYLETLEQEALSNRSWRLENSKALEHHIVFKQFFKKISKMKLFSFGVFLSVFLVISNSGLTESYFYRKIHLISDTVVALGTISYALNLVAVLVFFFIPNKFFYNVQYFDSNKFLNGLKVFLILLTVLTVWEFLFSDQQTIVEIFWNKSYRVFLKQAWFGLFVAFTEEFIFKWIILVQILIRIKETPTARRWAFVLVSFLFAISHIPIEISDHGSIQYGHQITTFLFSYFTCILFVRNRNFPLVVFLHFLLNISAIMVEDSSLFYFNWGLIFIGIYSNSSISELKFFRVNKKHKISKWALGAPLLISILIVPLISKNGIDYYFISKSLYVIDQDRNALVEINKAIHLDKENKTFYNHRGNVYYDLGEYDSAWNDYNYAIILDPEYYSAIRNRGLVSWYLNKYSRGIEDLTIAIENDLGNARVYRQRGSCYIGTRQYTLAKSDFLKSIDLSPNSTKGLHGLAMCFLKMNEFDSCIVYLDKVIAIDENFVNAYETKATAYTGLEKYDSSNIMMTRAIEMGSTSSARFYLRGLNYYRLEDYYNAIKEFEKTLEFDEENKNLYAYLGYSYIELEDFNRGCEYLKKAAILGDDESAGSLLEYCE